MRSLIFGAAAALTIGVGDVQAGDWLYVTHSENSAIAIDVSSVRRQGDRVIVWSVFVKRQTMTVASISYDYHLSRRTINCNRDTAFDSGAVYYLLSDTTPVFSDDTPSRETPIIPDTLAAAVAREACGDLSPGLGVTTARDFAWAIRQEWPE